MSRLSWPAAWTAAGAVAAALLAANIAAPPVLATSVSTAYAASAASGEPTPQPTASGPAGTDTTPPTTPGEVRACPPPLPTGGTPQGVVGLCWTASADDVGVTGYEVYRLTADGFVRATAPTSTVTVVSGLTIGRTYTFYIVAKDAAGNTSRPTAPFSTSAVTGMSVSPSPGTGDTTPPTRPTGMQANCLPDFKGTSFCWTPSTDDVGVTGYDVYRRTDTAWIPVGTPISTYFTEGNLVTGQSYVYFMVAQDAAGNLSLPSDLVTATASGGYPTYTPPPVSCKIEYTAWSWSGGFSANVKIINLGQTPMNNWTLRLVLPDAGQKVASGWSATWSQSGKDVTAAAMPWNSVIQGGASVQIGFNGTLTGANPDPTGFTLNGGTCIRG
ncbi:cellulose binding domain-containing protein [Microbispora rosea]|uniref:cellulose binding domain-containing protein n=1 Tax=Microbispora rosea TaxID=58117 RepID=UPI0004C3B709|nr:cellulose binding domain-containing protein [Microbispora rosea]